MQKILPSAIALLPLLVAFLWQQLNVHNSPYSLNIHNICPVQSSLEEDQGHAVDGTHLESTLGLLKLFLTEKGLSCQGDKETKRLLCQHKIYNRRKKNRTLTLLTGCKVTLLIMIMIAEHKCQLILSICLHCRHLRRLGGCHIASFYVRCPLK